MAQPALTIYSVGAGQPIHGGHWPGGRLSGDVALAAAVAAGALAAQQSSLAGDAALAAALAAGTMAGPAPVPYTVAGDGIWTWFNDPRAVYRNGATYVGYVTSGGRIWITKYVHATGTATTFALTGLFQQDDHDNDALVFLADGRLAAMWSAHNDTSGVRYRISTNPEDISAWGAEVDLTDGTLAAYMNPHFLAGTGRFYNHWRRDVGSRYGQFTTDWSSWSTPREWINTTQRPYVKACDNGIDRIDLFFSTSSPADAGSPSLYHCFMQPSGGSEAFFKSDGSAIGSTPVTPAAATRIFDGAAGNGPGWCWDIGYGPDGNPWVLWVRFASTSDHRYMFSRWTGSAWTTTEIMAGGGPLYAAEVYYSGGLCFDAQDRTKIYVSVPVSGVWEIQEWRTADMGATWSKYRDITSGTSAGVVNGRPYSPRNHDGRAACMWWSGTYTSFTSYNTAIKAVAAY